MQYPHCAAPRSAKVFCSGWGQPSWVIPSTVTISVLTASTPSIRHESTGAPSTSTAQVPHSPSSQPCLVPVRPMSSRKTSNKVLLISVATSWVSPLTQSCNSVLVSLPPAPFFLIFLIPVLTSRLFDNALGTLLSSHPGRASRRGGFETHPYNLKNLLALSSHLGQVSGATSSTGGRRPMRSRTRWLTCSASPATKLWSARGSKTSLISFSASFSKISTRNSSIS